jgi:hypothetical protein
MAIKAKLAVPPDTPNTYGSAKGLRSNACNKVPAIESRASQAKPAATHGARKLRRMSEAVLPSSFHRTYQSCEAGIMALPSIDEAIKAIKARMTHAIHRVKSLT